MPVGNPVTDLSGPGNYVPVTRTLTINGVTYDLSANRTWTVGVGSVTSVGLIMPTGFSVSNTPVTSSGDLTVAFASGYSLPTTAKQSEWDLAYSNRITSLTTIGNSGVSTLIGNTLNVPEYTLAGLGGMANVFTSLGDLVYSNAAGAPVRRSGNTTTTKMFLSQTGDGTTSAAPQWEAITTSTLGAVPTSRQLTINGTAYDLSADRVWSVGTITSLTGEATASGTGAVAVTLTNSAVIGKVLTGLNVTGGTVIATDTILTAFGKLQNQVNGLAGGVTYQGGWNASTNSPALSSGTGTKGFYYVVTTAGSTNLDGITDWKLGDWAIYNGTSWEKVDNTDSVSSVNGFTGAVSLTTANISEATNLYYTDTRSRLAVSLTTTGSSGAATYNNTTGVFNIPQYTLTGLGGVPSSRQLTINGVAYDLSADRAWSVGTVTSVGLTMPTGFSVGSSPITSSGTIGVTFAAGYSLPTTASQTNWDAAYNDKINSASVTGTTTKTLTLNQQDGGTVTASWTDDNTDAVTSVFGRTGAVVAANGDYNTSQVTELTNLYFTDSRARSAISLTTTGSSGAATYSSGTGVFNIPNYTLSGLGGVPTTRTLTINGTSFDLSANRSYSVGTVTSVALAVPTGLTITGSPVTSSGTLTIGLQSGYSIPTTAKQTEWDTAYTNRITSLTTTGSSGAATLTSNTLNIPNYTAAGLGAVPTTRTLTINDVPFDLSANRSWSVGDYGTW